MKRRTKFLYVLLALLLTATARLAYRYHALGVEVSVDTAKLPPAPATPTATEFTTVAYNVQCRPWFDDEQHKFTRMPKVLNPYDIVSFQEMFKGHQLMFSGLTHPVKVYHAALNSPLKIVGSGLGTVARFPLLGTEAINFTLAGDFQNVPASKGVLLTHLSIGGLPLDLYTTHMEAGHKSEYSMVARRKQAWELVQFVKAHSTADAAVIVQGDFNMRHSKPGQEDPNTAASNPPAEFIGLDRNQVLDAIVVSLGLKDLTKEATGQYNDGPDHILFRPGAKAALTPLSFEHDTPDFYDEAKQPLSDHTPMIGHFRIAPM